MATNDLSALNGKLATALRDPAYATWDSTELDDLLVWACAQTYPRVARRVTEDEKMIEDVNEYGFSAVEIDRVDIIDGDTNRIFRILENGTWEYDNDVQSNGGNLYINPAFVEADKYLRVHGWGRFDLSENEPSDDMVPLILATARAEAARREITKRASSVNWLTVNQVQNVTVNELVQMVNEADAEARSLASRLYTIRRPKPARR